VGILAAAPARIIVATSISTVLVPDITEEEEGGVVEVIDLHNNKVEAAKQDLLARPRVIIIKVHGASAWTTCHRPFRLSFPIAVQPWLLQLPCPKRTPDQALPDQSLSAELKKL